MNKKLHLMHVLFYCLCIVAALWQHGNPYFTLFTMIALIVVGIISTFLKSNDNIWKHLIALLFPLAAGIWLCVSLLIKSPTDIFIVESLSLAGVSFFFNLHSKEKGYRLLICAVLLIYGAGITRVVYFYTLIPAVIVLCLLLYLSRIDALSKKPEQLTKPIRSRYELRSLVLYLFISLITGMYLFSLFPINKIRNQGSFDNTFFTDSNPPPKIADWIFPDSIRKSLFGKNGLSAQEIPENKKKTGEVTSFDKRPEKESVQEIGELENTSTQLPVDNSVETDFSVNEPSEMVGITNQFKESIVSMFGRAKKSRFAVLGVLKGPIGIIAGGGLLLAFIIYFSYPCFKKYIMEMKKKNRCRKSYLKAEVNVEKDPALCLKLCYYTLRDLLDLAGHPRENNLELFEYAASTKVIDSKCSKDVIAVFSLYSKMVYSRGPATENESKKAFEHLTELRNFLLINLKKALK